jgi:hypothetical protein
MRRISSKAIVRVLLSAGLLSANALIPLPTSATWYGCSVNGNSGVGAVCVSSGCADAGYGQCGYEACYTNTDGCTFGRPCTCGG